MVKLKRVPTPAGPDRDVVRRRFQQERLHIQPYTLTQVPADLAATFPHPWSPVERLMDYFVLFPPSLLAFWLRQPGGHLLITPAASRYLPGPYLFGRRKLVGILQVDVRLLVKPTEKVVLLLGYLFDALLGGGAGMNDRRFSAGQVVHPALGNAMRRFRRQTALGYLEATSDEERFARALAFFWRDRREFNIVAPGLEKLFRQVLLNESFWANINTP